MNLYKLCQFINPASMLEYLITSHTRIRLLLKFFLNKNSSAWLRGLAEEFNESTNAIRVELNRFEKAGLLISDRKGNKKLFRANIHHPLFNDIHNILLKHTEIDQVIDHVICKIGNIVRAWLSGEMALGHDSHTINIILVGKDVSSEYLTLLIASVEQIIKRKIQTSIIKQHEESELLRKQNQILLLWEKI